MGLPLLVGIWFQVLLTPLKRVLFTFQSPYWSTIGHRVVLSLGGWSPLLHTEFHELRATLGHLSTESYGRRIQDCHLLRSAFPDCSASHAFVTPRGPATPSTTCRPPDVHTKNANGRQMMLGLGYIRFRSPLLTESRLISFPAGNEMFQFPALAPHGLYIHPRVTPSTCVVTPGCPIRRSLDQRMFDSSPEHIAAYHVLHRLSIPRHPPYTLNSLITLMKRCRVSVISSQ